MRFKGTIEQHVLNRFRCECGPSVAQTFLLGLRRAKLPPTRPPYTCAAATNGRLLEYAVEPKGMVSARLVYASLIGFTMRAPINCVHRQQPLLCNFHQPSLYENPVRGTVGPSRCQLLIQRYTVR